MPLDAKAQRERRARLKAKYPPQKKKFSRKRCLNCPKFFELTQPTRKFCSPACKDEYNHYGGAYGPLKQRIEKIITKMVIERVAASHVEILAEIQKLNDKINAIVVLKS